MAPKNKRNGVNAKQGTANIRTITPQRRRDGIPDSESLFSMLAMLKLPILT
jgi:hypothetical protein